MMPTMPHILYVYSLDCFFARKRDAPPDTCRVSVRVNAIESSGTAFVIVLPAPTIAPSPTSTGATSATFEPINVLEPIFVLYL